MWLPWKRRRSTLDHEREKEVEQVVRKAQITTDRIDRLRQRAEEEHRRLRGGRA